MSEQYQWITNKRTGDMALVEMSNGEIGRYISIAKDSKSMARFIRNWRNFGYYMNTTVRYW